MASMTSMSMSTVLTKSKAQVLRKQASRGAQLSFRLPAPFTSRGQRSACKSRKGQIIRSGLLDFLNPQTAPKTGARADELVSVLLDLARSTNGGAKARPETREQLEELVRWPAVTYQQTKGVGQYNIKSWPEEYIDYWFSVNWMPELAFQHIIFFAMSSGTTTPEVQTASTDSEPPLSRYIQGARHGA